MELSKISTTPSSVNSFYANQLLEGGSRHDPKQIGSLFEAMFYRMLMQESYADTDDGSVDSDDIQQAMEMFHNELANVMGQSGQLGIGDMVAKEIDKSGATTAAPGMIKNPTVKAATA